jgi:hypothetical protein
VYYLIHDPYHDIIIYCHIWLLFTVSKSFFWSLSFYYIVWIISVSHMFYHTWIFLCCCYCYDPTRNCMPPGYKKIGFLWSFLPITYNNHITHIFFNALICKLQEQKMCGYVPYSCCSLLDYQSRPILRQLVGCIQSRLLPVDRPLSADHYGTPRHVSFENCKSNR